MYGVLHRVVPPVARAVWRPTVIGLEHVPATGGVILASNHLSFVDSVVIPCVVPRKVVFLAKSDYFTGHRRQGRRSSGRGSRASGMLPVDRDDTQGRASPASTPRWRCSAAGEAFGIYPEGTRSRDGRLYRGRTGVAHLALTAGVPVVPVGLTRHREAPAGRLATGRGSCRSRSRFGEPIDVAGRVRRRPAGRARREVTDEIMAAIQRLTGQEQAGVYNERPAEA